MLPRIDHLSSNDSVYMGNNRNIASSEELRHNLIDKNIASTHGLEILYANFKISAKDSIRLVLLSGSNKMKAVYADNAAFCAGLMTFIND